MAITACADDPSAADEAPNRDAFRRVDEPGDLVPFDAYLRDRAGAGSRLLTVYIEGDGRAWTGGKPPDDPTPVHPIGLFLARADPGGPILYLGRPCQYRARRSPACRPALWTDARFSAPVVDAYTAVIDRVRRETGALGLVLVGYSGGAALAALIAERRQETRLLVTVAGVLDQRAWTEFHRVPSLLQSLNPADELPTLARIRQIHLVGSADAIVPPRLVNDLVTHYPPGSPAIIIERPVDHACCWAERWPDDIVIWRHAVDSPRSE